jgi:hypothetical protein
VQSNAGTTMSENRSVWFGKAGDGCADLAVTAVLALPTHVLVGGTLSIVHAIKHLGSASAGATTTRYYLSRDAARGEGDVALGATGARGSRMYDATVCAPCARGRRSRPDASQQRSAPSATSINLTLSASC